MKRLFIAVKVVPEKEFINDYSLFRQKLFRNQITWVEPAVMHITLKFLGNISDEKIPAINQVLEKISNDFEAFRLNLDHLGIFGSSYAPRVIWWGASQPHQLTNLGLGVIDGLHEAGFLRDRQNFVPHLTLGRIKKVDDKKSFQSVIDEFRNGFFQEVEVRELLLLHSTLTTSGPVYQQINSFCLK